MTSRPDEPIPGFKFAGWVPPKKWGVPLSIPCHNGTDDEGGACKLPFDLLIFPNGMFAKRLLTPVHGFRSLDTERFNDDDLCRH